MPKRGWYSTLSEEQKEEVCKKRREMYAQKKALAKEDIRNQTMDATPIAGEMYAQKKAFAKGNIRNQTMVATPIGGTFEEASVHYHVGPNIEKSQDEDACGPERKRWFTMDGDKKKEKLNKDKEACVNKNTDSTMHRQMQRLGVMINEGSQRNIDNQSCDIATANLLDRGNKQMSGQMQKLDSQSGHITIMDLSNRGKNQISVCNIFEVGSKSCGASNSIRQKMALGLMDNKHQRCTNFRYILRSISSKADTLPPAPTCKHSQAKRIHHETKGFCCADGEISLVSNDVPDELYKLFTSDSVESIEFLTYIRTFNNKFALTSFGVKYDKNLCRRNKGIYTFRVQGQVYHYINDLLPLDGHPSYLQLYFYYTEHEIENRVYDANRLNPSILKKIIDILKVNPYCAFFRTLTNVLDLENHQIHIRSNAALDQRVYNAPSSSQVAAIWVEKILLNNIGVVTLLFLAILGVVIECNTILGVTILYNILYYFLMEIPVGIKECKDLKRESSVHIPRLKY